MTAKQESGIRNLSYGDRDSLGIYQQRAGWGTVKQRLDPVYAINKFYAALEKVKNRATMSLLEVALAVQRPSRAAYLSPRNNFTSWEGMANQLLKGFVPSATKASAMVYSDECVTPTANTVGGGWHKPLDSMRVGSVWGMRYHPILHYTRLHNGVDLSASSGTRIYAVGSGTITTMARGWNGGAGNHIAINLGDGNVVKYLHMSRFASDVSVGSKVTAGTLIGYVGSTGLATGPHLHFSWYVNGKGVDPVPKLCQRSVSVPGPRGCSKYDST
jgi:murein DD-endopeptidase MepM/ murein hydrolase activator NlpD